MDTAWVGWNDEKELYEAFEETGGEHYEILIAFHHAEAYEGSAFVLYRDRRDGKLYIVEGSHCSCMGFEHQWCPGETTLDALRVMYGTPKDDDYMWQQGDDYPHRTVHMWLQRNYEDLSPMGCA